MRTIKIITHPYTLIICFLFILISGEHLGGFYLLYIILALPIGGIHSILALTGIAMLLFSYQKYNRKPIVPAFILNIAGLLLLFLSVFFFFYRDQNHYNYGTFYQTLPLISLFITSIVAVSFFIYNIMILFLKRTVSGNNNFHGV
jgi:hypothetical protein